MLFFIILQMYFGVGDAAWLHQCVPSEEGWDVGVGSSSFIKSSSVIFIENPLAWEGRQNIWQTMS
jgi:hypothetical protein